MAIMKYDIVQHIAVAVHARALEDELPPLGVYKYPYSQLQHVGFAILFIFPALAFIVYLLRLYGRLSTNKFGWDDNFITLAMAVSLAETGCSYQAMRLGFIGVPFKDVPPNADFVEAQKWNFIIQILYNPILALVKNSVLLFLFRIGGQKKRVKWSIVALLIFNVALMIGIFVSAVFQCRPVSFFWERARRSPLPPEGTCFNQNAFYIWTASLTIVTDILVLALPFWIFLGLKMAIRVRLALIGVFTMGAAVTVFSILRLAWLVDIAINGFIKDGAADIRFVYSAVETNLAIITASAPALRPLFMKWFPRFFASLRSSANKNTKDRCGRSADKRLRGNTSTVHTQRSIRMTGIKARSEARAHSPSGSEDEIIPSDGIVKTSEIAVAYDREPWPQDQRGGQPTQFDFPQQGNGYSGV